MAARKKVKKAKKTAGKVSKKKVVKKKAVKKVAPPKKPESADLLFWLALIAMVMVIPIVNIFLVPFLAIVALKNARKVSLPWLAYTLGIVALLAWIVQLIVSIVIVIVSMAGY